MTSPDTLNLSFDVDWLYSADYSTLSAEYMWQELHSKLLLITDEVPFCPDPGHSSMNKSKVPWFSSSMRRAFKA